jgi:hypothetical protein
VHHIFVNADAAGTVTLVDAALLIALTVDANLQESNTESGQDETSDSRKKFHAILAFLYVVGICSVLLSLGMTITSVEISTPLTGFAQHVAIDASLIGFVPLILGTLYRFIPQIENKHVITIVCVIILAGFALFLFWVRSYAPSTILG